MESKDRVTDLVGDLLGKSRHQSPHCRQAESKVQSQESPQSQQSPHSLTETGTGVLARRFKVTLTGGKVLLHSAPSGLTRREAIELSRDWGEVVECAPCPPAEISEAQKSVGDTLIEACQGTGLEPGAFRALLNDEDLADIAAGLIPVECLRAYAERFSKRLAPAAVDNDRVRCGDCQHFQRIDHSHTGRCARGHGRHWLWDTDKRQCEDFEAAVEGEG
jgi:hypothetical protein